MSGERALEADGLVKAYRGRRVADGVTLRVKPGEIVGLLGPNGAGKSTSFNMVVGLVRPDAGVVRVNGEEVTRLPMYLCARKWLGYLSHDICNVRRITVWQNVLSIL